MLVGIEYETIVLRRSGGRLTGLRPLRRSGIVYYVVPEPYEILA